MGAVRLVGIGRRANEHDKQRDPDQKDRDRFGQHRPTVPHMDFSFLVHEGTSRKGLTDWDIDMISL